MKAFRCAERPPFHKGTRSPASAEDVACSAPKTGKICVAPHGGAPTAAVAVATTSASKIATEIVPRPAPSAPAPAPSRGSVPVVGRVLVGIGIAGLVTSGVAGGIVLDATSTASAHCERFNTCDADGLAAADRGRTVGLVATIAFGVGAAALATGVVLLVVAKPREQRDRDCSTANSCYEGKCATLCRMSAADCADGHPCVAGASDVGAAALAGKTYGH